MKVSPRFLLLVVITIGTLWAVEVPKSTENEGMGKYERINKLEAKIIELSKEINQLKSDVAKLEKQIEDL